MRERIFYWNLSGVLENMEKKTVGYTEGANDECPEVHQQLNVTSMLNSLNLDYCRREQSKPGDSFGPFVYENYVLHIVLKGCGKLRVGGGYKLPVKKRRGIYHLPWSGSCCISGRQRGSLGRYMDRLSWLYGKEGSSSYGIYRGSSCHAG